MFEVTLGAEAEAFYAAADRSLARRIARCLATLERDPRQHNNIKRLTGDMAGLSRVRIGDWRVLSSVDEESQQVSVVLITHRRDVYE